MKRKAFIAAVAVAAATDWWRGAASAGGGNAKTKVTIKAPGGDVYGYVKSTKPNRCADDRKVKVFRQKGGEQGGGDDIKVGATRRSRTATGTSGRSGSPA